MPNRTKFIVFVSVMSGEGARVAPDPKNPNPTLADNWLVGDSSEGCRTEAEGVGPDLFSIRVCKADWKYGCRIVLNATDE
jgi:hypothetical protein